MPSLSQIGSQFSSRKAIKEEKLNEIVNDIGSDPDTVMNLGFALGFPKVSIDKYDALNNKNGKVSNGGTREMLFDCKRNTSPEKQVEKLREALVKAKLTEIAETHLPANTGNLQTKPTTLESSETQTVHTGNLQTKPTTLKSSETQTVAKTESPELLCLKCDRVVGKITEVINNKQSTKAIHSKVRNIKGRECLVQLIPAEKVVTKKPDGRYDVITLTTADVKLYDEVYLTSAFDGYKKHRATLCKGCSQQVGWYCIPDDTVSAAPFHALRLQNLIHDSYDSDNSLNDFFARNRIAE